MLTQWTEHLDRLVATLNRRGHEPEVLRGGMGAKSRAADLAPLEPQPDGPPLLVVATGPYIGEGFDCPGVLASSLAKRAPGYTSLGFPDPRRLAR